MALRCELCGRISPDRSLRCDCGFELATDNVEHSIALASRDRRLARDKIARGLVAIVVGSVGVVTCGLLALMLLWMQTLFATIPVVATVALAAMGVVGIGNVVGGTRDHARAGRVLRAAEAKRALPVARLISSS